MSNIALGVITLCFICLVCFEYGKHKKVKEKFKKEIELLDLKEENTRLSIEINKKLLNKIDKEK